MSISPRSRRPKSAMTAPQPPTHAAELEVTQRSILIENPFSSSPHADFSSTPTRVSVSSTYSHDQSIPEQLPELTSPVTVHDGDSTILASSLMASIPNQDAAASKIQRWYRELQHSRAVNRQQVADFLSQKKAALTARRIADEQRARAEARERRRQTVTANVMPAVTHASGRVPTPVSAGGRAPTPASGDQRGPASASLVPSRPSSAQAASSVHSSTSSEPRIARSVGPQAGRRAVQDSHGETDLVIAKFDQRARRRLHDVQVC